MDSYIRLTGGEIGGYLPREREFETGLLEVFKGGGYFGATKFFLLFGRGKHGWKFSEYSLSTCEMGLNRG